MNRQRKDSGYDYSTAAQHATRREIRGSWEDLKEVPNLDLGKGEIKERLLKEDA